jgi:hypothetical protein
LNVPIYENTEHEILNINDNFNRIFGDVNKTFKKTIHGNSLEIFGNSSFSIEINESYKNMDEVTDSYQQWSMQADNPDEYWIFTSIENNTKISLVLIEDMRAFSRGGYMRSQSYTEYRGNLDNG